MKEGRQALRRVDQNGLKTGQALTIILLALGFVFDSMPLVAFVAIAQLLGAIASPLAPYRLFYQHVIRRFNILPARITADNPEPHRFAMLVGAIFNGVASILLVANLSVLAWILVWIVIILANLNFWLNFCLGCWMYYQFNRLGVPGFVHAPVEE